MFQKTTISYSLIYTRTCAYQGIRNLRFLKRFVLLLSEWPLLWNQNNAVAGIPNQHKKLKKHFRQLKAEITFTEKKEQKDNAGLMHNT